MKKMQRTLFLTSVVSMLCGISHASDIEIYQQGSNDGSVALMLMLDQTQKMKALLGKLNDGFSDYYACGQSVAGSTVTKTIGGVPFTTTYCRYNKADTWFLNLGNSLNQTFFPGRYSNYLDYVRATCEHRSGWQEYKCYDRLSKAKIALISLLLGNAEDGISALSDDKVVGLSSFSSYMSNGNPYSGKVNVVARRLDAKVTHPQWGAITQRMLLAKTIASVAEESNGKWSWDLLQKDKNSPIATAYSETAAALMGTTTKGTGLDVFARKATVLINDIFRTCNGYSSATSNTNNAAGLCTSLLWTRKKSTYPSWLIPFDGFDGTDAERRQKLQTWISREYPYDGFFQRADYPADEDDNQNGSPLETYFYYKNNANKDLSIKEGVLFPDYLPYSGFAYADSNAVSNNKYVRPQLIQSQMDSATTNTTSQCHGQGIYVLTAGTPEITNTNGASYSTEFAVERVMQKTLAAPTENFANFKCDSSAKLQDWRWDPNLGIAKRNALWSCISNYSERLNNKNNPTALSIKTAVAGVGRDFSYVSNSTAYDLTNSTQLNNYLTKVNNADFSKRFFEIPDAQLQHDVKNAAKWGAYGGGGYYSVLSVEDIVNSVNSFINVLAKDIPSASASHMTLPVDALNAFELQDAAYSAQYEPTVSKAYATWFGNIKKYKVMNGVIQDKSNLSVFEKTGLIKSATTDLWASSNTDSNATLNPIFQGGGLKQIPLKENVEQHTTRALYTNRKCSEQSGALSCSAGNSLKAVSEQYFTDAMTSQDPLRGYLMLLLGYNISQPDDPDHIDLTTLKDLPELRQLGAVLHSDPILLTQKGKLQNDGTSMTSTDREDYLLFGTTQGMLHVLNAKTGVEKFAFVPDEMLQSNQKKAFLDKTIGAGSTEQFLYGVDGPWTAYTEYVPTGVDGTLTVGQGKLAYSSSSVTGSTDHHAAGKQWVYGGLRMGGQSYYALNLSDLNNPKLKFHIDPKNAKITNEQGTSTVNALSYMGQSWSKPVIAKVNWQGADKLVMLVGGGYDASGAVTCNEPLYSNRGYECPHYAQSNKVGAGIYMFDADNGDLLWWGSANASNNSTGIKEQASNIPQMQYSVVSEIKPIDQNGDGLADHLYFGDLGGQLWRIDLNNSQYKPANTPLMTRSVRVLNLYQGSGQNPRFYQAPVFSIFKDSAAGILAAVSIASGNKSRPLQQEESTSTWQNDAIYTVFDKDVVKSNTTDTSLISNNLTKGDLTLLTNDMRESKAGSGVVNATQHGWYYPFSSNKTLSEKVLTDLVAMNKQLLVSVYDASKNGTVQGCSAGIKGETTLHRFCMPYGQCTTALAANKLYAGVGVVGIHLGSKGSGASNSRTVLNNACQGDNCTGADANNNLKTDNKLSRKFRPTRWFEY